MADSRPQADEIKGEQGTRLKHLDFVLSAAVQAVACLSSLYNFAKDNAGPLRTGIDAVEGTVKAVVGPVYEKVRGVPLQALILTDRKVDAILDDVGRNMPSILKKASSAAQRAQLVARSVAGDVQRAGVVATSAHLLHVANEKYFPVAEKHAAAAWHSLNQLPVFPQVANIVVPTAAHWTEKYNQAVECFAGKGYAVAQFLPLVPTERIAKVFGGGANATIASPQSSPRLVAAAQ